MSSPPPLLLSAEMTSRQEIDVLCATEQSVSGVEQAAPEVNDSSGEQKHLTMEQYESLYLSIDWDSSKMRACVLNQAHEVVWVEYE